MPYTVSDGRYAAAIGIAGPGEPAEQPSHACRMVSFDRRVGFGDEHDGDLEGFLWDEYGKLGADDLLKVVEGDCPYPDLDVVRVGNGTWALEGSQDELGERIEWTGSDDDPGVGLWKVSDDVVDVLLRDEEAAIAGLAKAVPLRELYLYDHSGLSLSTSPAGYPDRRWDVSRIGVACVDENLAAEIEKGGGDPLRLIDAEVEMMSDYFEGEVYEVAAMGPGILEPEAVYDVYLTAAEKRDPARALADIAPDIAPGFDPAAPGAVAQGNVWEPARDIREAASAALDSHPAAARGRDEPAPPRRDGPGIGPRSGREAPKGPRR